jgi:hypothetical protein
MSQNFLQGGLLLTTLAAVLFVAIFLVCSRQRKSRSRAAAAAASQPQNTPLCIAAMEGSTAAAALLVKAGCDVDARSFGDVTALAMAVSCHNNDVVDILLGAKADIELISATSSSDELRGVTALLLAVRSGNIVAARSLVAAGANVHARVTVDGVAKIRGMRAREIAQRRLSNVGSENIPLKELAELAKYLHMCEKKQKDTRGRKEKRAAKSQHQALVDSRSMPHVL